MHGFYIPRELAEMLGGGESTYRMRAERGEFVRAMKRGGTWFIPLGDVSHVGRGYDEEFAPARRLSPELPRDPSDIVLARSFDGQYGIYIDDVWFGAGEALQILAYLREHEVWLKAHAEGGQE